jgi:hypothetical protein
MWGNGWRLGFRLAAVNQGYLGHKLEPLLLTAQIACHDVRRAWSDDGELEGDNHARATQAMPS